MELFFELEIVYVVIGIFILGVTAFVTTRDFVPKTAFKRGMFGVVLIFAIMISAHYFTTTARMSGVKEIFNEGGIIICENKMHRTISQSVLISKELEWRLEGHLFVSDNYERAFHTSRCVELIADTLKVEK
ncbi:MAG: hypothetical protein NTZ60_03960 [Campylobacterales bacterium]|nr:hypothetical protein [Campylobacterales bacterium]